MRRPKPPKTIHDLASDVVVAYIKSNPRWDNERLAKEIFKAILVAQAWQKALDDAEKDALEDELREILGR